MEVKILNKNSDTENLNPEKFENNNINYNKEQKTLSKVGFTYFILLLIMFIVPTTLISIFQPNSEDLLLIFNFIGFIIGIIVVYFYINRIPKAKNFKKDKLNVKKYLFYLIMGYGLMILGYTITDILKSLFIPTITNPLNSFESSSMIVTFLYAILFGPIIEELLFRKFLIDRTIKYGEIFAITTSAFMFMLYHMNIYQFLGVFLFGIVLAEVYVKTNNIIYPITIHQIGNFFGLFVPNMIGGNPSLANIFGLFVYIVMALSIGFSGYYLYKIKFKDGEIKIPKKKLYSMYFKNYGTISFIIFAIIISILNI